MEPQSRESSKLLDGQTKSALSARFLPALQKALLLVQDFLTGARYSRFVFAQPEPVAEGIVRRLMHSAAVFRRCDLFFRSLSASPRSSEHIVGPPEGDRE